MPHAQRFEHTLCHHRLNVLPRHGADDGLQQHIAFTGILPARARLELGRQRATRPVWQAGTVVEQGAQRDARQRARGHRIDPPVLRATERVLAVGVAVGQIARHRCAHIKPALAHQLQRHEGDDRFGERSRLEHRVGPHRRRRRAARRHYREVGLSIAQGGVARRADPQLGRECGKRLLGVLGQVGRAGGEKGGAGAREQEITAGQRHVVEFVA